MSAMLSTLTTSWKHGDLPHLHPRWDDQVELEQGMLREGADRFRAQVAQARARGNLVNLPTHRSLLSGLLPVVAEGIKEWVASWEKKRGVRPIALSPIKALDPEVAAFVTLRSLLASLGIENANLLRAAVQIGAQLEHEAMMQEWKKADPALWSAVKHKADTRGSTAPHRKRVNVYYFNKEIKPKIAWADWSEDLKQRVGLVLLDIVVRYTKRFSVVKDPKWRRLKNKHSKPPMVIEPNPEVLEWIGDALERHEVLYPVYMPTLMPPMRWETPRQGGYWTPFVKSPFMIRFKASHESQRQRAIDDLEALDMPEVYAAVNTVQEVPWRINKRVLDVALDFWEKDRALAGMPRREAEPVPFRREGIEESPEEEYAWRRAASDVRMRNAKRFSVSLSTVSVLKVAQRFADEEAFYFPHMLDFRGRMYPIPTGLQPQGGDLARGLLTFAKGKPVTVESAGWLAIQVANTWGEDKIALEDRISWTEERNDLWRLVASDPVENRQWTEASDPWQCLAAILEWVRWLDEGEGMVSSLPIRVDGTCNGIQHLSAMVRDEVGGATVNLVPSDRPRDIYQEVADQLAEILAPLPSPEDAEMRQRWARLYGDRIPRALTKRPVMILPYGGTRHAYFSYTFDWVNEVDPKKELLPPEERTKAVSWMTKHMWDAVGACIDRPREVMNWLQSCAQIAAKTGLPLYWTTPVGFVVRHFYGKREMKRVETHVDGQRLNLVAWEVSPVLDPASQLKGIAPNYVHSMDASALMECVNLATANGIESLTTIHDAYGTVAADMWLLSDCLRVAFIETYRENVLEQFRAACMDIADEKERADFPPLPPMGTLDLEAVRDSTYFFA